jgi:hypothetical protein
MATRSRRNSSSEFGKHNNGQHHETQASFNLLQEQSRGGEISPNISDHSDRRRLGRSDRRNGSFDALREVTKPDERSEGQGRGLDMIRERHMEALDLATPVQRQAREQKTPRERSIEALDLAPLEQRTPRERFREALDRVLSDNESRGLQDARPEPQIGQNDTSRSQGGGRRRQPKKLQKKRRPEGLSPEEADKRASKRRRLWEQAGFALLNVENTVLGGITNQEVRDAAEMSGGDIGGYGSNYGNNMDAARRQEEDRRAMENQQRAANPGPSPNNG